MDVHWDAASQKLCGFRVFPLPIKIFYEWKIKGAGSMGSSWAAHAGSSFQAAEGISLGRHSSPAMHFPCHSVSLLGIVAALPGKI